MIDLNGDGQPEVFTKRYGGMFGMAGVELELYIKGKSGSYPDIEIQGPGTCLPVWRWNGSAYAIHKRCAR